MLFNSFISMYQLFFLTLVAFFSLFMLRHLCIKRTVSIFFSHLICFCILFVATVGGESVQNDGYSRLEKFIELEKNHTLNDVKQNRKNNDSMLAIDLAQFKNSDEFKAYLKKNDHAIDQFEAIFIGWLFVLASDIAMGCLYIVRYLASKGRSLQTP